MKLLLCGSVVLATSLGLLSCSGDPTSDFQGTPTQILAEPSSIFLDQGTNEAVIVTLVDEAGDPLVGDFAISAPGTGITIERNPDFLGTNSGFPLESQAQFIVTAGDAPLATAFTLTAGGLSLEIPVKVTPTVIQTAVFSNANPAVNEPVTVTAEGFTFLPDAVISFAGDSALVLGVAEDGTSMTFLPPPGTTGPALVENVAINFIPGTPLALPTTAEMTVADLVPIAGTGTPGTAPVLTVAAPGATTTLFDGGTYDYPAPLFGGAFGTFPARLYQFTVPADGDFTVTLGWNGTQDFGVYYFLPDGTTETGVAADGATADVNPETSTSTFTAGTYLMAVVNFVSPDNPGFFSIEFTTVPPATGE